MAEHVEDMPTERGWLFNKEGQEILPADAAQYAQLWKDGWRTSPAAFGIETHPSRVATAISMAMPVASVASASTATLERLDALEARMGRTDAATATMTAEMESLTGRVTALEDKAVLTASGDEPHRPRRP